MRDGSPLHSLSTLGAHSAARRGNGKLEEGSGAASSGTYAKQC